MTDDARPRAHRHVDVRHRSDAVTVTAPASGVPATGSDTFAVLLLALVFVAVGLATRRIGRRRDALAT